MKHQISDEFTPPPIGQAHANGVSGHATLQLLAKWRAEDATERPEELKAAEKEVAEFKKAMNEHRIEAGEPLLYP